MSDELTPIGDLPQSFMEVLMLAFRDYSVALNRYREAKPKELMPLGSGVLVKKRNRFGILTARHCLHACTPKVELGPSGRDSLTLVLRGARAVHVQPQDAVEHILVTPKSEEFGPDLTFIEILPGERLASLKAISSFWSLDQPPAKIIEAFGKKGTPLASIGFPQEDYNTQIEENHIHHVVRHMSYLNAIGDGDVFERDGWDYVESTCNYDNSTNLPSTFRGVSGGPVWGMELRKHKSDAHISIEKFALI